MNGCWLRVWDGRCGGLLGRGSCGVLGQGDDKAAGTGQVVTAGAPERMCALKACSVELPRVMCSGVNVQVRTGTVDRELDSARNHVSSMCGPYV